LVELGSVWQEVDPRTERFVKVLAHWMLDGAPVHEAGHEKVAIRAGRVTIVKVDGATGVPVPGSRPTFAKFERFNGKRGGYARVNPLSAKDSANGGVK
jgi:hypothetical protein